MGQVRSVRLVLLLILALIQRSRAHYNLAHPVPYHKASCNRRHGCGPCPRPTSPLESSTNTVWARGRVVNITWHKNNHKDGMYRRSLVPISQMTNAEAHTETAFNWGCWTQGEITCRRNSPFGEQFCGGDKQGHVYTNLMTVPDVFPDGQYVFAMVWFGGGGRTHVPPINEARFSNFASCSYVTIRGGVKLGASYQRTFTQGIQNEHDKVEDQEDLKPGQCWSTSDRVNQCGGRNCTGVKVQAMTPFEFKNGTPPPLLESQIQSFQEDKQVETSSTNTAVEKTHSPPPPPPSSTFVPVNQTQPQSPQQPPPPPPSSSLTPTQSPHWSTFATSTAPFTTAKPNATRFATTKPNGEPHLQEQFTSPPQQMRTTSGSASPTVTVSPYWTEPAARLRTKKPNAARHVQEQIASPSPSQPTRTTSASASPSVTPSRSLAATKTPAPSATSTSRERWTIIETEWVAQCGLYLPCIEYCRENGEACIRVLELAQETDRKLHELQIGSAVPAA